LKLILNLTVFIVQIRRSPNASRLPHLPSSFSTPLPSFGVFSFVSPSGAHSSSNLPLSFIKVGFSSVDIRPTTPSAPSLRQSSFPLSRSSLRSIRQVQSDVSRSTHPRRFSSTPTASINFPSISHFTSLPLPLSASSLKAFRVSPQKLSFFPLQRLSFTRNSLRRFFARRRFSEKTTRQHRHSPLLLTPVAEEALSLSTQGLKTVDTTRYANT
jgi:hypothetical protein